MRGSCDTRSKIPAWDPAACCHDHPQSPHFSIPYSLGMDGSVETDPFISFCRTARTYMWVLMDVHCECTEGASTHDPISSGISTATHHSGRLKGPAKSASIGTEIN